MSAARLQLVAPAKRELGEALPAWERAWFQWVEEGVRAFVVDGARVAGWALVAAALVVASGPALVGQVCRTLARGER